MNKTNIGIAVVAIIIIVLVFVYPSKPLTPAEQAVRTCLSAGGSYDLTTKACSPRTGATPAASTPGTTTVTPSTPPAASSAKVTYTPAGAAAYITLTAPVAGQKVFSPMHISGQAMSSWYFEGQFPVVITDASGKILQQMAAHSQGSWTIEKPVPFSMDLVFAQPPSGSRGFIIFKNDNPSGDPARDMSVKVPVTFK